MSEPNFNPGRYCGDVPLPPPDNQSSVDMFTPQQQSAIKAMIREAVQEAMSSEPPSRKGKEEE